MINGAVSITCGARTHTKTELKKEKKQRDILDGGGGGIIKPQEENVKLSKILRGKKIEDSMLWRKKEESLALRLMCRHPIRQLFIL